jgi:hypothetical protein
VEKICYTHCCISRYWFIGLQRFAKLQVRTNFCRFGAGWALVINKHFLCLQIFYQLWYCGVTPYFLVRTRIAEWFTKSRERFRCEVTLDTLLLVHISSSKLHSFCATEVSSGLPNKSPWLKYVYHGGGWESLLHRSGPASYSFCTVVYDCSRVAY